jgi:hypothetical protein
VSVEGQTGKDNKHVDTKGRGGKKPVQTFHILVPMVEVVGNEPVPGAKVLLESRKDEDMQPM